MTAKLELYRVFKTVAEAGMPIKSLAIIDKADENGFVFREDD